MIRLDKKHMMSSLYASVMCKQHDILVLVDTHLNVIKTLRVIRERVYDEEFKEDGWELRECTKAHFIEIGPSRIRVEVAPRDTVEARKFKGYEFNNIILYGCPRIRDDVYSTLEARIR